MSCTVSEGNEYFNERLYSSLWANASDSDKGKALVMAERMIRATFKFREGLIRREEDNSEMFSDSLRYGIFEQALYLLGMDPTAYPKVLTLGLASAGASGASASFDSGKIAPYISPAVIRMIGDDGSFTDRADPSGEIEVFALGQGG